MYVEVRRHPELQNVFQGGEPFPIVDILRGLAASSGEGEGEAQDPTWFWITFALGLAQLSALADTATFATTVEMFRQQFVHVPGDDS
jgi:hypothetical protein